MAVVEFETCLDDNVIHLPEDIAAQLPKGKAVRAAITSQPDAAMTPDDAWKAIVSFVQQGMAKAPLAATYTWRREDAYDHL